MQKTLIITGATGGVGQSVAKACASSHALILVGRDAEKLKAVYGQHHVQIAADCTTPEGADAIFSALRAQQHTCVLLAHCVGNIKLGAMHRMPTTDFEDCVRVNLFSAFYMLSGFIKELRAQSLSGAAVLVSSAAARIGTPNHEAVAAAKGGLEALVRGAAATYAPFNIRINAVAPGIMDTPATAKILGNETARDMASKQYPLAGIGSSDELAQLLIWLLSDAAQRVTGQVWSLDGGFSTIRPLVK